MISMYQYTSDAGKNIFAFLKENNCKYKYGDLETKFKVRDDHIERVSNSANSFRLYLIY